MLIYKITNLSNGKIYIGQTSKRLSDRQYQYRKEIHKYKSGKIKKRSIIGALARYGYDNFSWKIIENNISDGYLLDQREIFWINHYQSTNRKIGYNLCSGGNSNFRGIKQTGKRLKQSRKAARKATQVNSQLTKGKPQTGAKLLASRQNIKMAIAARLAKNLEIKNKFGKLSLPEHHKLAISKGLKNNPKVKSAAQKPRFKTRCKLFEEQIFDIYYDKRVFTIIASEYKITTATVCRIKNHQRYFKIILENYGVAM